MQRLLRGYLDHLVVERGLSANTIAAYRRDLNRYLEWLAAHEIDDIDLKLARTAVKSPVAGVVSARTAKIGAIASGGASPLFTVIRDGEIELKADVSEDSVL